MSEQTLIIFASYIESKNIQSPSVSAYNVVHHIFVILLSLIKFEIDLKN